MSQTVGSHSPPRFTKSAGAETAMTDALGRWLPRTDGRSTYRPDIEGLRAVAVLAVLLYHLGAGWLPGGFAGVDVFFVLSGYLITTQVLGELARRGRLSLTRFWARRLMRLLPAATLVSLVTGLAVWAFGMRLRLPAVAHELEAVSVSGLNLLLASRSVDYLAEDIGLSPLQHYWSLGVEAQFYLVWPLFILLLAVVVTRRRWPMRPVLLAGVTALLVVSFASAALLVLRGDVRAYFLTPTRLWEPALGGLMALMAPTLQHRLAPRLRSWAGAAAVVLLAATFLASDGSGWPAWPALVPTVAAAVLVLGDGAGTGVASRVLSVRPLTWFGAISYPLYLWHWPLIMAAGGPGSARSPVEGAALGAAAVVSAWGTVHLVENPLRYSAWVRARLWSPYLLALVSVALSYVLASAMASAPARVLAPPAGARAAGAAVLPGTIDLRTHPDWSARVDWVLPSPLEAPTDVPRAYADGCQQGRVASDPLTCTYGDQSAGRVVALVGDSKALQWLPALDLWATARGVRLVTFTKTSCPFVDVTVDLGGQPYSSCQQWYGRVFAQLRQLRPQLVITSQFQPVAGIATGHDRNSAEAMQAGLVRTWRALLALAPVLVLADTPHPSENVYECVLEYSRAFGRCAYPREPATVASAAVVQRAAVQAAGGRVLDASGGEERFGDTPRLLMLDMTDAVCPDADRCPPVVGQVLIYRSGSHLTRSYVDSLAPRLGKLIDASAVLT